MNNNAIDASPLTPTQVLESFAPQTGLDATLTAFFRKGTLEQRFAKNPLLMAPMAGVSDAAYRMMARAGGAALAYSEMVSVAGLHFGSAKTMGLVLPKDPEPDIAVQLFGSDPEQFREAVVEVQEQLGARLALIDINMACPMPKVTKGGAGSALLENPSLAARIVESSVRACDVPVTVKIRQGRRMGDEVAPSFARVLQDSGASAVAIHGRYANQLYRGNADWPAVKRVVEAVSIPVIGSGDVMNHEDAMLMMRQTGCAAVMIARGTYGNPWVFSNKTVSTRQRIAAYCCHVSLLHATNAHLARARSLAGWYFRGMPNAASWRNAAMSCNTLQDYLDLAHSILEELHEQ